MKISSCIFASWIFHAASVLGDATPDTMIDPAMVKDYEVTGDMFGDEDVEITADVEESSEPKWFKVSGGKKCIDIAVSAGNKHVFALDENRGLWHRGGYFGEWEESQSPGNFVEIDTNGDGTAIWAIDTEGNGWLRQGYTAEWEKLSGFVLTFIGVSADGVNVWGVNTKGVAFWRPGKSETSYWQQRAGAVSVVSTSGDGKSVWAVNKSGDSFCWDKNKAGGFAKGKGNWQAYSRQYNIGIKLKSIDIAADASIVYAASFDDELYYATDCFDPKFDKTYKKENGEWKKIGGGKASKISVEGYGKVIWAIDADNEVWMVKV